MQKFETLPPGSISSSSNSSFIDLHILNHFNNLWQHIWFPPGDDLPIAMFWCESLAWSTAGLCRTLWWLGPLLGPEEIVAPEYGGATIYQPTRKNEIMLVIIFLWNN